MNVHTDEQFERFMSELKETNHTLDFFCDFDKIERNVENIRLSLCMLNSLIGAADMRKAVETVWNRDKGAFEVMDILIAVRMKKKEMVTDEKGDYVSMRHYFESVDSVMEFLEGTGLKKILEEQKIKNLVDYVFGVETGLDTNARKNRSGHLMEGIVAGLFDRNGIKYRQEVYSSEWEQIKMALGEDEKRFDFVVESRGMTYLVEVNFYNKGGGSKLNEVARSYSDLAPKINGVEGFEFVWITDGVGWKHAKNKLHEAYNIIPKVYNLTNAKEFMDLLK